MALRCYTKYELLYGHGDCDGDHNTPNPNINDGHVYLGWNQLSTTVAIASVKHVSMKGNTQMQFFMAYKLCTR